MKKHTLAKGIATGIVVIGMNGMVASAWADTTNTDSNTTSNVVVSSTNTVVSDNGTASGAANTNATVDSSNTTSDSGSTNGTGNSTDGSGSSNNSDPSLIPGDFFYFVKTIMEKIQYALTFNDTAKAQLLAQFAQNRIGEANALIKDGKTDLAATTLQQAISDENQAMDKLDGSTTSGSSDNSTSNGTSGDGSGNTTSNSTGATGDDSGKQAVKVHLANNILALTAALQHVNNPKAQQALEKNIEKDFAHLEKRLEKGHGQNDGAQSVSQPTLPTLPVSGSVAPATSSAPATTGSATQSTSKTSASTGKGKGEGESHKGTTHTGSSGNTTTVTVGSSASNNTDAQQSTVTNDTNVSGNTISNETGNEHGNGQGHDNGGHGHSSGDQSHNNGGEGHDHH